MLRWLSKYRSSKADSLHEQGSALYSAGDARGAEKCFRAALDLHPRHVAAQINLALALLAQGLAGPAETASRRALETEPRSLGALVALGCSLEGRGALPAAISAWNQALAVDPGCLQALCNLSSAYLKTGDAELGLQTALRAVGTAPDSSAAHLRLGHALLECRQPVRAAQSFREAANLAPASTTALNGLGYALDIQGCIDAALGCYEQVLAMDPNNVQAHVNRASIWQLKGRFAEGWDEYEWRLRAREQMDVHERIRLPRWDGSPLGDRSLFVYMEQGLGDQILYASCLPDIEAQTSRCGVQCEPRLASLFRRSFPRMAINDGERYGHYDVAISFASLPRLLRRSPSDCPGRPYLVAAPERVSAWRERLRTAGPGLKIGLSWRGGAPQTSRASRSIDLEMLLPVLRNRDLTFVNLQYGDVAAELTALRSKHGISVHHWPEAIDDYDETAALVGALDLTVSVCTAVVHLAGALGRPVWVVTPVRPEPRYGASGETMPWYRSARMFRQAAYGDWQPVVDAVAAALSREQRVAG
jgi:tetratricopeptide (TPR) repeat protein